MKTVTSARWAWIISAIVFSAIFLTILFFAYIGKLPPILTENDKLAHVILYGIATLLGHKALSQRRIRILNIPVPVFPGLFALFTLSEELAQGLSPNRSLDAIDLIASFFGIAIGYWLAERIK
ncbi:VanZ family protein [Leptolyngbya sp. AN10]|uniref:VanZ family protein n=1 Tax=Leptolyngbya sp. AN10 TaxID=3423365 RepID=UPI003D31CE50